MTKLFMGHHNLLENGIDAGMTAETGTTSRVSRPAEVHYLCGEGPCNAAFRVSKARC